MTLNEFKDLVSEALLEIEQDLTWHPDMEELDFRELNDLLQTEIIAKALKRGVVI